MTRLALFPLRAVLFPNARMRLRLFEPRYLALVRDCFRGQSPFGVVRIRRGAETLREPRDRLRPPELEAVGVTAHIIDWDAVPGHGQQLQVLIEGARKFRHSDARFERNHIVTARADYLPPEAIGTLPASHRQLEQVLASLPPPPMPATVAPNAAGAAGIPPALRLSHQLAQYLPLPEAERYRLLELGCAAERLRAIERLLRDAGAIH